MYDIFISYAHSDGGLVRPMLAELESAGLRVWVDEARIEAFESIQSGIENGLAKSKALLAWYSIRYHESRACQWELTAAFGAAQRDGDVRRRILLVNPEPSNSHIDPVELRDARFGSPPKTGEDLRELAAKIGAHVAQLTSPLGEIRSLARPQWYGSVSGFGSNRFVGRVHEFWEIHSGLQGPAVPAITNRVAAPFVRLAGIGGAGKSLLAEEYALRFGAAYPGGIFWLRAFGHDSAKLMDETEREAERERQFGGLAKSLGVLTMNNGPAEIHSDLVEKLKQRGAYLWVVDDVPFGMTLAAASSWMAPTPNGHTLVTTRADTDDWRGTTVKVDQLEPQAAYRLLTHRRSPTDEEKEDAEALVTELGNHALGLELAARGVKQQGYAEFRRKLADRSKDELDFVAKLFEVRRETLPHRETVNLNISRTLLISIEALRAPDSMDFLRLAAQLAPGLISRKLVSRTFALADGVSADDGEERAQLAIEELEACSLAQCSSGEGQPADAVLVHTLVARTVRFQDHAQDRWRILRRGAADALAEIIEPSRGWQGELASDLDHARMIILSLVESGPGLNKEETRSLVMVLQQIYPYTAEAGALWQKALEICLRVLGEQAPNTLIAMNRRAVWLYGLGDPDEALDMQEKVLELSRTIRGEEHADTRIAIQNLLDTLEYSMSQFKTHSPKECAARLQALIKERGQLRRASQATGPPTLMNNPV